MSRKEVSIEHINPFDQVKMDEAVKTRLKHAIDRLPLEELASFIETEVENLMQLTEFKYTFICFMEDGAYALHRAITEMLGFSQQKERGPSKKPPQTLDVRFANGTSIKVPWGDIAIPGMGKDAMISMAYHPAHRTLYVTGQCEKRYVGYMDKLIELTNQYLKYESIYTGHAIRIDDGLQPHFIDISSVDQVPLFLTPTAQYNIQPIIARLTKSDMCRAHGVDLKYGALMYGPYGTGKTLLAFKLAKIATENNWTFIYLTAPEKTADLLKIANQLCNSGTGVLTFVEDIDQVLSGERDGGMNQILNLMDGGENKKAPIITVFTTNHLEAIDPTFLRGKRIGATICLTHFDKATAINFLEKSLGDVYTGSLDEAGKLVEELKIVPAFLAEIVDRVKAERIYHDDAVVTESHILAAIDSYKIQIEASRTIPRDEDEFGTFMRLYNKYAVRPGVDEALKGADLL